jgi:hypothetical protein
VRDGINHAEVRIGLNYKNFVWSDDGEKQINYHDMVKIIAEIQKGELSKIRKRWLHLPWNRMHLCDCEKGRKGGNGLGHEYGDRAETSFP